MHLTTTPTNPERSGLGRLGSVAVVLALVAGCAGPGETVNQEALRRWTERPTGGAIGFAAPISSDVLAALYADREYRVGPDDVLTLGVYDLDRLGERSSV